MYARVATFEAEREQLSKVAETIRKEAEGGPPEGVPGKEFLLLTGRDSGKVLAVALFETEEDLRKGDEALNAMSPPAGAEGIGRRTGVEFFEVAVHARV
jgi:hypothetical protein